MAKRTKKGRLQARIDKENAREESRTATPKVRGDLPAGVTGIAKLTRVDFDEITDGDYKGEQRLYCHGVCIEPKEYTDRNKFVHEIEGALVQPRMITLADTKSQYGELSFSENVARAEERLKLLGFPTEDFDDLEGETLEFWKDFQPSEDGEENGEAMYFKFNTWSRRDNPDQVNVKLLGPAEDFEQEDEDEIEEAEESVPRSRTKSKPKKEEEPEEEEYEEEPEDEAEPEAEAEEEEVDYAALAKKADKGDEDAQDVISEKCEELGIDYEDTKYKNWVQVVAAFDSDEEEESEEEIEPAKTEIWGYKPPRSNKVKKCEVTHVVKKTKIANLRSVDDGKLYKSVPWSKLVEV